jgi:hypothetical protein
MKIGLENDHMRHKIGLHLGTFSVINFYRKLRNDPNSGVHP